MFPSLAAMPSTVPLDDLLPWSYRVRRRGRPRASDDPAQRARHIACGKMMLASTWPVKKIAAHFGIRRFTAYRWLKLALTYEGSDADELRRIAKDVGWSSHSEA